MNQTLVLENYSFDAARDGSNHVIRNICAYATSSGGKNHTEGFQRNIATLLLALTVNQNNNESGNAWFAR